MCSWCFVLNFSIRGTKLESQYFLKNNIVILLSSLKDSKGKEKKSANFFSF